MNTMALHCSSVVLYIWQKLVGEFAWCKKYKKLAGEFASCNNQNVDWDSLPDELLVDILSRLPADCVLGCRKDTVPLTGNASFGTQSHGKNYFSRYFAGTFSLTWGSISPRRGCRFYIVWPYIARQWFFILRRS
ncbi:hypothetical protein Tsubulata_022658 [Turnera subulata]|uniref:F-box domain-containing protein n=1 Tax=Turnera subulata TaxID=218843 RepID=A0A9Q0GF37_9ROSI|nr:hypothetical protein Tsubulata_022658 [Turnera subulata]